MKKRSKTDTVHVSTRMREPLRAKLEKAAKAGKVSLNNELVARVERSFSEDEAFGGPELRRIAILMAATFAIAGQASAPDEQPEQWLKNPAAYISGMAGVLRALMVGVSSQDTPLAAEALKSVFLTEIAKRKESRK